jgi:mannose-6-phosphate isomerase-like protein (cupin superfamily)
MLQTTTTTTTPGTVVLDPRAVATLPWRPFAALSGVRDRVLWQDPADKSLAGLLHLDPDASVLPHIHLRASHHLWVVSGSCTIDGRTLDAGSYVFISAGRSHGIEQVGRAGCLLFYVYLHQGTTRPAAVAPDRRVAPLTAEQQAWAAAAELAGRTHTPIAEASGSSPGGS